MCPFYGELHRLWRDHVGIRPRYAGRGASASRSLTSDINNTPPCVLSSNSNKCSSSVLCSDTVSQVCVARGPDVRNATQILPYGALPGYQMERPHRYYLYGALPCPQMKGRHRYYLYSALPGYQMKG
ncbi:hypothetical protein Bbelb_054470 [Branchiostoma belcheri]|nr:hypothetical protein Bbelb_054470 [Branchiostoma belcheri]